MKTFQVSFVVELPLDVTPEQFNEWIQYQIGTRSDLKMSNPLESYELPDSEITNLEIANS